MTDPTTTLDRTELIRMLRMAYDEIITLQRAVTDLEPRALAYDNLSRVIGLIPQPERGYDEDIAWRLKQQVDALIAEHETERPARTQEDGDD